MKRCLLLAIVALVACGGPKKGSEHAIVPEGSGTPETCCCKSTPATSEDGKPVYETANPMECSTKQGDCVPEVQCAASQKPD